LQSETLSLHDLVKSYLIHYGYIETLQAMETQDDESLMIEPEEVKIPSAVR
jgi:hypothetical protein